MQGNPFYIRTTNRGSKQEKETLMLQWAHTMSQRYVNQLVFLCYHYLVNTLTRTILGCIEMAALLFERTLAVQKQKNSRKNFKNYLKKKI